MRVGTQTQRRQLSILKPVMQPAFGLAHRNSSLVNPVLTRLQ